MNIYDIILILLIALALAFAVRSVIKQKKNGSCCGNCSGCPHGGKCGRKE